jgi:tryptophanyl-tRNA synthetase
MLAIQDNPQYQMLSMVADVHTITTPYIVEELRVNRREVVLDYLAAGLDPQKSILFLQADVPEHLELAMYFSSVVSIARMQHLPTFKEKVKQHPENVTMALLNYPVLMAADILIYKSTLVPVGMDQEPHLEIAREIARKMNSTYGTDFPEPKRFVTKGEYVPSLNGVGKMSKSVGGSFIALTDSLETIVDRLASCPTDSGQGTTVPTAGGVANLLTLVELFQGVGQRREYEQTYTTTGLRYQELKYRLAQVIFAQLQPMQEKRHQLAADRRTIDDIVHDGASRARAIAQKTILEVREKMGLPG